MRAQSTDSDTPFKVDGDKPLRMRVATLGAIVLGVAAAVGYGVNLKQEVAGHTESLKAVNERLHIIELEARTAREAAADSRAEQRIIGLKIDYLVNGRRGPAPSAGPGP